MHGPSGMGTAAIIHAANSIPLSPKPPIPCFPVLQEFALKHKSEIRKDPEFRAQFHQVGVGSSLRRMTVQQ